MGINNSRKRRNRVKTKNFIIEREECGGNFNLPWEIRRKTGSGERLQKGQNKIRGDMLLGTLEYAAPDRYGCTALKLLLKTGLTRGELVEILDAMDGEIIATEYVNFIQIRDPKEGALRQALRELSFEKDSAKAGYLVWEQPAARWILICMLLGMAAGMMIGSFAGDPALGVITGVILGAVLGLYVDRKDRQKRTTFRECRKTGDPLPKGINRL